MIISIATPVYYGKELMYYKTNNITITARVFKRILPKINEALGTELDGHKFKLVWGRNYLSVYDKYTGNTLYYIEERPC